MRGGGDRETSGGDCWEKEIGVGLVKRMGEDKDIYGRRGGGSVEYVPLISCSKHGNHSFFSPVSLSLILASNALSLPDSGLPLTRMLLKSTAQQQVGMRQLESRGFGLFPHKMGMISSHSQRCCCHPSPDQADNYNGNR